MDDAQLARRFGIIEQQLRALSDHLGVACPAFASDGVPDAGRADGGSGTGAAPGAPTGPSGVPAEVVELAQAGKAVQAVSLLRKLTGATLVEAKRVVDSL